jgi:hypothetical protein
MSLYPLLHLYTLSSIKSKIKDVLAPALKAEYAIKEAWLTFCFSGNQEIRSPGHQKSLSGSKGSNTTLSRRYAIVLLSTCGTLDNSCNAANVPWDFRKKRSHGQVKDRSR